VHLLDQLVVRQQRQVDLVGVCVAHGRPLADHCSELDRIVERA
jgi:hypothetical protein